MGFEGGNVHEDLIYYLCQNDVILCNTLGEHHSNV